MKRSVTVSVGAVLLVLVLVAAAAIAAVDRYLDTPLAIDGDRMVYEVRSGMAFTSVAEELASQGVIDNPDWLRWYAQLTGRAEKIRAGEYSIDTGTTARQLLDKFVTGDVRLYSFTIIEGWSFRELLDAMARSELLQSTITYEQWPELLDSLASSASHPEGLFLPETYHFPKDTTDRELLQQSYELMQETLAQEWQGRAVNLPLDDSYAALTLASIIEKETAAASERAQIGGVFVRRLQKGMRLQTDPTVIYGVGASFDGNLTRQHLTTDTPYRVPSGPNSSPPMTISSLGSVGTVAPTSVKTPVPMSIRSVRAAIAALVTSNAGM